MKPKDRLVIGSLYMLTVAVGWVIGYATGTDRLEAAWPVALICCGIIIPAFWDSVEKRINNKDNE